MKLYDGKRQNFKEKSVVRLSVKLRSWLGSDRAAGRWSCRAGGEGSVLWGLKCQAASAPWDELGQGLELAAPRLLRSHRCSMLPLTPLYIGSHWCLCCPQHPHTWSSISSPRDGAALGATETGHRSVHTSGALAAGEAWGC